MIKTISAMMILGVLSVVNAMGNTIDSSTYGNIEEIITNHLALDLEISFDNKTFKGNATHYMEVVSDNVQYAWFDAVGLDIHTVTAPIDNNGTFMTLHHNITTPNNNLGQAIMVELPEVAMKGAKYNITIHYTTNDKSTAVSWMTKEQTHDKTMPYLYSQCEDIACRSIAPLQDTPAAKFTYEARIVAETQYKVYMSANSTSNSTLNTTHHQWMFKCDIKIQSYLIAIAVGDLQYQNVGGVVGFITEPGFVSAVASEFSNLTGIFDTVEAYMKPAGGVQNPYAWGTYTILILPPSFPMGGMENPLLTFASPTIITGDKSQVYVAAHEMAHSWTGNTVTCADWANFWLNEGFTVFLERKCAQAIHGDDFAKASAFVGNASAYQSMEGYGLWNSYSSLHPNVRDDLPDNSFSVIPYEKGYQFLYFIEQEVIGEHHMQLMLNEYISENAYMSIKWPVFRAKVESYIDKTWTDMSEARMLKQKIDWMTWVYGPGLPPYQADFTTPELTEAVQLANEYTNMGGNSSPANFTDFNKWDSNTQVIFIQALEKRKDDVTVAVLARIDADLNITHSLDPNCQQEWVPLSIKHNYGNVMDVAHTIVTTIGRMKYLSGIYNALMQNNRETTAQAWFQEAYSFYSPYAQVQVGRIVNDASSKPAQLNESMPEEPVKYEKPTFLGIA